MVLVRLPNGIVNRDHRLRLGGGETYGVFVMTETKFTPGPWECQPGFSSDAEYRVFREDGDYLTTDDDEHAANARLIAAAPAMYAALEEIERMARDRRRTASLYVITIRVGRVLDKVREAPQ